MLIKVLSRINAYLVRSAQCKYKRLRRYLAKARRFLVDVFLRQPGLFAHWRFGTRPDGWTMGARESRGSRRVLREPGGATPPGHSPSSGHARR